MSQWQGVDTVLLDMDGTLLDLQFDNFFWQRHIPEVYAKKNKLTFEDAERKVGVWYKEKEGTLDWYCIDYWSDRLGINVSEEKMAAQHRIDFRPGAQEFLAALSNDPSKRVILLTNAHPRTLSIKVERLSLAHYFDALVSSHEFGFPKENDAFWPAAQTQLGFESSKAVFIDDSLAVLSSAKRFGIAYVWGVAKPDTQAQTVFKGDAELPVVESFDYLTQLSLRNF